MADINNANFVFGANRGQALKLEVDAKSYKWDAAKGNFIHTPTGGGAEKILRGEKLHDALSKASESIKTAGISETHHFDQLHEVAAAKKFRGAEHPLEYIIESGKFREAYKGNDLGALGKMMVTEAEEGAHLKFVPSEEVSTFRRNLIKGDEHAFANFKGDVKNARNFSSDILAVDFTDPKFDKPHAIDGEVDGLVGKYGTKERPASNFKGYVSEEASTHIRKSTSYTGAEHAIDRFAEKSTAATAHYTEQAEKLVGLRKTAEAKFGLPKTKAAAKAEIEVIEKGVADHLGQSAAHGAGYQELPKHVRNTLDSAANIKTAGTKAISDLGAGAGKAAKDGGFFTKGAGDLAKFAEKDLKGMKGLWNKRTFAGKAALIGVPTVAVAYMAGIGSKGKHTDQVMQQSLDQGQGVGIA